MGACLSPTRDKITPLPVEDPLGDRWFDKVFQIITRTVSPDNVDVLSEILRIDRPLCKECCPVALADICSIAAAKILLLPVSVETTMERRVKVKVSSSRRVVLKQICDMIKSASVQRRGVVLHVQPRKTGLRESIEFRIGRDRVFMRIEDPLIHRRVAWSGHQGT